MVSLQSIEEALPHSPSSAQQGTSNGMASLTQNPENGPWIIQKFGGTSVGKFIDNIAEQVVPTFLESGNRVALVCSARSGNTKATGTTNLLITASLQALRPSASTSTNSPGTSQAPTPSANGPSTNPLSLTSQVFQRTSSSPNIIPPTGSFSSFNSTFYKDSRSNSPAPTTSRGSPTGRRSLSNSITSLRDDDKGQQAFEFTVEQIRNDHLKAAKLAIRNQEILEALEEEIDYDCDQLRSFLMAAQILEEISPRSKDTIIGVGERLSCRIVAAVLRDRGIDSELVSLENIIARVSEDEEGQALPDDSGAGGSESLGQHFYDRLSKVIGDRLRECGNRVPVVTGFFGVVPGSLLSQVGRGYTDLCAALCAVGTQASELQIWKEVDGIFTADPRKVEGARLLSHITPEEAAELTYYGSEVIHPFTMEQVINASIPIRIKNVEKPKGQGTVIYPDPETIESTATTPPGNSNGTTSTSNGQQLPDFAAKLRELSQRDPEFQKYSSLGQMKIPTAVTIKDDTLVLNVRSNRKTISHGFLAKIFGTLDRFGIVVDLISTSEVHVSIAMNGSMRRQLLDKVVKELKKVGDVYVLHEMAILSLVGKQMKNMVGIAGRMFSVLADGKINIEMISQGASEINVSCVIARTDSLKALRLVHGLLELEKLK